MGGYISKKTRNAKWGTGAIDALSERLQVELSGLRGFSAGNIRKIRLFFETWATSHEIQHLASVENDELRGNFKTIIEMGNAWCPFRASFEITS